MKSKSNWIPSLFLGGITLPLSQVIILNVRTNNSTDSVTPNKNNAGFQVPAGKKFIVAIVSASQNGTSAGSIAIGYGDTATSSVVPTNAVYYLGTSGNQVIPVPPNGAIASYPINFEVPSGKYLFVNGVTGTTQTGIFIYGYLVDN